MERFYHMKNFGAMLLMILGAMSVSAKESSQPRYRLTDLNFAAPTVFGEPAASESRVGSIIYDLDSNNFKGLFADGSWSNIGSGGFTPTAPSVQIYTSGSGNYVPPANALYIRVQMVGGGGGGAGGFVDAIITNTSPAWDGSFAYSVGSGGSAGNAGTGGGTGGAGGSGYVEITAYYQ
jgi:hypothetical protein